MRRIEEDKISSSFLTARSFVPNCLDDLLIFKIDDKKNHSNDYENKIEKPSRFNISRSHSMASINTSINASSSTSMKSTIKVKTLQPMSLSFKGVCLIADISGFTKLSSKLCAAGKDGVDELQKATNGFMSKLVDAIYEYDGDIIKFAGDAIICTFKPKTDHQHTEYDMIQEACARALEFTWKVKDHKTEHMTMHIAIGFGLTHLTLLGGFNDNWEILVSGEYFQNIGNCLDEAGVAEIVTTREFYEFFKGTSIEEQVAVPNVNEKLNKYCELTGEVTPGNNIKITSVTNLGKIELKKPSDRLNFEDTSTYYAHMQKCVPLPIMHSLANSTFETLAQLRDVTTMFMKFDGYSYNEHANTVNIQKYFFEAQKILDQSGGFLRQFLVDDKGCVLIGIWGINEYTYLDNQKRALLAAIDIRERLLDMKMKASFGITTGSVYCGLVGSNIRREFCVVGSVVNLAARLMGKSKGSVLVDQTTYDHLELKVKDLLIRQEQIVVKGIEAPITTYLYDTGKSAIQAHEVVEVPVRNICKEALEPHISELVKGKAKLTTLVSATRRMSLKSKPQKKIKHTEDIKVNIHIIEGHAGMGTEDIRPWLIKKAEQYNLGMIAVEVTGTDSYSTIKSIFVSLISHDVFYNRSKQYYVIQHLMKELYSKDLAYQERIVYPVIQKVFGITTGFKQKRNNLLGHSERVLPLDNDELYQPPARDISPHVCKKVAYEILAHLLSERPYLILIEKAHGMDEDSWRILSRFVEGSMKAVFIYTQEPISHYISNIAGDFDEVKSLRHLKMSYLPTAMYQKDLLRHDNVHFLNLPKYSFQETRSHFLYHMNFNLTLPAKLDLHVYKLSGGNPFWINHIISFINEHGIDEFMQMMEFKLKKEEKTRRKSFFPAFLATATSTTESIATTTTDTAASVTTNENLETANKLNHFILCRLEKLSLESQEVLRGASIVGNNFSEILLRSCVTEVLHPKLNPILTSLVESGWITKDLNSSESPTKDKSYWFCHEVILNTLYQLSPKSLKETLHAKIAAFLVEQKHIDYGFIAYHYLHSGPDFKEKSFTYSLKAAENYLMEGLYDNFMTTVENAIVVVNTLERSKEVRQLIQRADNRYKSKMLASVMLTSQSLGYGDPWYLKMFKSVSCWGTSTMKADHSVNSDLIIMNRLDSLKEKLDQKFVVESTKSKSPTTSYSAKSKSFFSSSFRTTFSDGERSIRSVKIESALQLLRSMEEDAPNQEDTSNQENLHWEI